MTSRDAALPGPSLSQHPAAAQTQRLPVAETFLSIQGEGRLCGVPSFFIRTSGCNLRCGWCDTPYASWNPEGGPREIDSLVAAAAGSGARHVVLTGGEPMMFAPIEPLAAGLRARGLHVTIETAGTIYRNLACDLMSISPKLSNSTPSEADPRDPSGVWRMRHEQRRINPEVLQGLIDAYPTPGGRQIKFVVRGPEDLAEIEALLRGLRNWREEEILLMPEGVTPTPADRKQWLIAECLRRNWTYCTRLHIELFGNVRGT